MAWGSPSARVFGWLCECRSAGRKDGSCVAACMCVPAFSGCTRTPGDAGELGEWGSLQKLPVPTSSEGHRRASTSPVETAVFAKTKIWRPGSHRGLHPNPAYSTRAATLFLTLLAGRSLGPLGTFSCLLLTPTSPDPSPSGIAVVVSGSGCICAVSLPSSQTSLPPLPEVLRGVLGPGQL